MEPRQDVSRLRCLPRIYVLVMPRQTFGDPESSWCPLREGLVSGHKDPILSWTEGIRWRPCALFLEERLLYGADLENDQPGHRVRG